MLLASTCFSSSATGLNVPATFHDISDGALKEEFESHSQSVAYLFIMAPQARLPSWLTHCTNDGQLTPPSSPPIATIRHSPGVCPFNLRRRSMSLQSKGYDRQTVRQNLKLPSTAIEARDHSPVSLPPLSPTTNHNRGSLTSPPGTLRRTPIEYDNLRAAARLQTGPTVRTPLLPSPVLQSPWTNKAQNLMMYTLHNPDSASDDSSVDSETILSYYYKENSSGHRMLGFPGTDVHLANLASDDTSANEHVNESHTASSISIPIQPTDHEFGHAFSIDESWWLANTKLQEEGIKKGNTRGHQVVQHCWSDMLRSRSEDELVSIHEILPTPFCLIVSADGRYNSRRSW